MKIAIVSFAFFTVFIAGCAATTWVRPGANTLDFAQDKYQCQNEAERPSGFAASGNQNFVIGAALGNIIGQAAANQARYNSCMEAHGWVAQR